MNKLIHTTSPMLVLHQLGWGIPHAMRRNHAYAFYLDSITNSNGNTTFSLAWKIISIFVTLIDTLTKTPLQVAHVNI